MKHKILIPISFSLLLLFSCSNNDDMDSLKFEQKEYIVPVYEQELELSRQPVEDVIIEVPGKELTIDFESKEFIKDCIFGAAGEAAVKDIRTRGELVHFYQNRETHFQYGYSSFFDFDNDGDFVLPKLEYALAQECFQDNCSSDTRRAILQAVIEKQKLKYEEYLNTYTTIRTGLFLMTVILLKEKDMAFIRAMDKDKEIQNTLSLTPETNCDKEFGKKMIQYSINFLSNK